MNSRTELRDFRPDGKFGSEATDDAVIDGFEIFLVSYNAEAAFCGYLGVACEIAIQRPHLFKRLLPTIIDPACCMGVESAESFIACARALIERDATKEQKYQDFSPAGVQYFHQFMIAHVAEIQRVLEQWAARKFGI
jgi:hypothetical protein